MDPVCEAVFKPRLDKVVEAAKDDATRSQDVLKFYFEDILKPIAADPLSIEYAVTDGKGDGGLDGYLIDPDLKRVILIQIKWFDTDSTTLSQAACLELLNFYKIRYLGKANEKLNDAVRRFLRRAWAEFGGWDIDLHFVTNGTFDGPAKREYDAEVQKGLCSFQVVGPQGLCKGFVDALAQEEPISNQAILSLSQPHHFVVMVPDPADPTSPKGTRVVFMLAEAKDLRRTYGRISNRLFIRNLRYGKGKTSANEEMKQTAETDDRLLFPMLHNGVSLVAEKLAILPVPLKHGTSELDTDAIEERLPSIDTDELAYASQLAKAGTRDMIWLQNFQIVNGAQSTVTLSDIDDRFVGTIQLPCKISETGSRSLAQMIARCNNTQNQITPVDLIANEPLQTFFQNYAATQIDPPIFYQRKAGEKWVSILRASGKTPEPIRQTRFEPVYQSFLAFSGHPGEAYSRLRASVYPNTPGYDQISRFPDRELILLTGLLGNYEKVCKKGKPEFTLFWTQWAIAAFGHIFRRHLTDAERTRLRARLLSDKGLESWKTIRRNLVWCYEKIFAEYFHNRVTDPQDFFKNIESPEAFGLRGFTRVKTSDVANYLQPSLQTKADLLSMKEAQRRTGLDLSYYDVNFAVVAVLIDKLLSANDDRKRAITRA